MLHEPQAARRALIVIDVQNEYFGGALPVEFPPPSQSVQRVRRAIEVAQARGIPLVVVRQQAAPEAPAFAAGSHGADLHPLVANVPATLTVTKRWPSAFASTELHAELRRLGIDTITLAGYVIQNCVLATAFDGLQLGFRVEILSDAVGTLGLANAEGHVTAEELFRVLRVVLQSRAAGLATVDEWIAIVDSGRAVVPDTLVDSARRAMATLAAPRLTRPGSTPAARCAR